MSAAITCAASITEILNRFFLINTPINIAEISISIVSGLLLGVIIAVIYKLTTPSVRFSMEYSLTLMIICCVISLIISVIGTNIARAFSLAGALSIIRFRSMVQTPRDIAYIFFAMGTGLSCGAGLYIPALIFVIVMGTTLIVYGMLRDKNKKEVRVVKICVPENKNFDGMFDDVLKQYTTGFALQNVRSMSGGTVYELSYLVSIRNIGEIKEMLDALRIRNANFNVSCMIPAEPGEVY